MAFKRWAKTPSRKGLAKNWNASEMKIIGWCLNSNIKVGISPDWKNDMTKWKIDIDVNNKKHTDPSSYDDDVVYNKVTEYYKYYYDKHNKQ